MSSDAPSATASAPRCPNPNGGDCLGTLAGGTYHTTVFELPVTYTVPAGWQNLEDLPGNFLLLPPGASVAGAEAGTANYIGVGLNATVARADCDGGPDVEIAETPEGIARALDKRPGLTVSTPEPVKIGGLTGVVINVKLDRNWSSTCPWSGGKPVVRLLIGLPPSNFENSMGPGFESRLYLLRHPLGTLDIEIALVNKSRLADLTRVAEQLTFGE